MPAPLPLAAFGALVDWTVVLIGAVMILLVFANVVLHVFGRDLDRAHRRLRDAGIRLGKMYPRPMVDHREARRRALAAFAEIRIQRKERK